MSCDLLQTLARERRLDVHELADLLNIATSSAYRYFNGETELRYGQLRTLIRSCRDRGARLALIRSLLGGTGIYCVEVDPRLDLDGDGDVDTQDIIVGCIKANRQTAKLLGQAYDARADHKIDEREGAEICQSIDQLVELLIAARKLVTIDVERVRRRHQVRPLKIGGTR